MQARQHPDGGDAQPQVGRGIEGNFVQSRNRRLTFRCQVEKHAKSPGATAAVAFRLVAQNRVKDIRCRRGVQFAKGCAREQEGA